jgi:hypothetical protein
MWPREVFYQGREFLRADPQLAILGQPGVYVLYRNDVPFYVGQAKKLRNRLWDHANVPSTSYYNFWNYFSVFVPDNQFSRGLIEALLIAAMPTENRAMPKLQKVPFPRSLAKMVRDRLNPKRLEDTANERRAAAKLAALTRKRRAAGRKAAATRSAKAV